MDKHSLPIKSPCQESWEQMRGGDHERHCAGCDRDVFNLSAMTRREAEALLARRASKQRLCVRYVADEAGRVEFQRETLIPPSLLLRGRQLAMGAGLAAALGGCVPTGSAIGSVAAHYAADEAGERGTCAISLEPLLPVTLQLHAAACQTSQPQPAVMGQMELIPVQPVEAPPPQPPHTAAPAPAAELPAAPKRPARQVRETTKKPPPPQPRREVFMGDIAF